MFGGVFLWHYYGIRNLETHVFFVYIENKEKIGQLVRERLPKQVDGYNVKPFIDPKTKKKITHVVANYDTLTRTININSNRPDKPKLHTFYHELIHALTTTFDGDTMRCGLMSAKLQWSLGGRFKKAVKVKHRAINEGMTNVITNMLLDEKDRTGSYPGQTKIAEMIKDAFGEKIVIKAMFEGSKVLEDVFNRAGGLFGKGKFEELSQIAEKMLDIDEMPDRNSPENKRDYEELIEKATEIMKSLKPKRVMAAKKDVQVDKGAFERYLTQPTVDSLTIEQRQLAEIVNKLNLGGQFSEDSVKLDGNYSVRSRLKDVHIKSANTKGVEKLL